MGALLALLTAVVYGTSDFAGGLASRRLAPGAVTVIAQLSSLIVTGTALVAFPSAAPTGAVLGWGAIAGIGGAIGVLSLYYGLSLARMSVVATLSGVLTALIPAIVGLALGNHLSGSALVGVVIAVPAIVLVSGRSGVHDDDRSRSGLLFGLLAGVGFALLLIALDRAGTHAGAWPLVPDQLVCLLLVAPFARGAFSSGRPQRRTVLLAVGAGMLGSAATLCYLAATGRGQLATVAVLSSMYPVATVLLARFVLAEQWTRRQVVGLVVAAAAIVLISA